MQKITLKNWTLSYDGKTLPAAVPGDITADLFRAGIIEDPYFGMNHCDIQWIVRRPFTYSAEIAADKAMLAAETVILVFDGIDVYSTVKINGNELGKTDNMFLQYRFDIRPYLKEGKNTLTVDMEPTLTKMEEYDMKDYYAIFNPKRIFVRKAQCHFGWDWAPEICGYGIWGDAYLEVGTKCRIETVQVVAEKNAATLFTELNYNINATKETLLHVDADGDTLRYSMSSKPFGKLDTVKEIPVSGKKNLVCFMIPDAKLWWPAGYGEQPLYNYKVELIRGGKTISEKEGRFGFRKVELIEEPKNEQLLGYMLRINGRDIFCRGSNWVPIECFTGTVTDEKYKQMISLAREGNLNMLRIWGGGIYEKDVFFDLCDEYGIMVWQDMMLACADIPEEEPAFVSNMLAEVEYQVKRLRNHPALVYWCGGNEKTGTFGLSITRGDFFTNCMLRGLVTNLDRTRPFANQSPCSYGDVGNDLKSGEDHYNSFERSLDLGLNRYRDLVAERAVSFVSEAALMGPVTMDSLKRFMPADKLWPMNEVWEDRLMKNPYGLSPLNFAQRQMKYATDLYGEPKNLSEFTAKAMLAHTETMRCESEFTRSNEGISAGFMNWMYSDIWPQATWAVVDYYGEPKQVYYQMRRSYAPLLITFFRDHDGKTQLLMINDSAIDESVSMTYGGKVIDGKLLFEKTVKVDLPKGAKKLIEITEPHSDAQVFLFADYKAKSGAKKILYSDKMWTDAAFKSDYTVSKKQISATEAEVTVKANAFAKAVFLSLPENGHYKYSDNFLDIDAGDSVTVRIIGDRAFDVNDIAVTDYVKMINA